MLDLSAQTGGGNIPAFFAFPAPRADSPFFFATRNSCKAAMIPLEFVSMGKREKLRDRFKSKPKDFSWIELASLLKGFGYVSAKGGKTGGARVRFMHDSPPPVILHKPHPSPVLKRYQMEQIYEFLIEEGLL